MVIENVIQFSVQIDKKVYNNLEQEVIQKEKQLPEDKQKHINIFDLTPL